MNLFSFQKTCLSLSLILVIVLLLQLIILCRCHLQQQQRPGNDAEYHSRHRRSSASAGSRSQQQYGNRKCPPSQSSAASEWPRNGSAVFSDQGAGSSKINNRCGMNSTTRATQGPGGGRNGRRGNNGEQARRGTLDQDSRPKRHRHTDLSLWIDEHQVRLLSGLMMMIHVISEGHVQPYILDPNFENYLPVIPAEVGVVNFTWRAGDRKYLYHFDRLLSFNEDILLPPVVSVDTRGRIPRKPKAFSVFLPCSGQRSGVAAFTIGLLIQTRRGRPLTGTPIRLKLRKECAAKKPEPDPECDKKCANGGWCNKDRVCNCPEGYMGQYCQTALCYPQCMNGGVCTAPGICSCPQGYHGLHCEGGICGEKCLNGGKCIQKDTCDCTKGYYGHRCEYSKCMIPCLNGGRCRGVNLCRCPPNFAGDHCEIGKVNRTVTQRHICSIPCRHGHCVGPNKCECHNGFYGRRCQHRL